MKSPFEQFKDNLRRTHRERVPLVIPAGVSDEEIARGGQEVALEQQAAKRTTKAGLLDAAKAAVADRGLNYGKPEDNFVRIAFLWSAYLGNKPLNRVSEISSTDVAMMMALMKIARLQNDPTHLDSWTDIAGYAACGAEISA